MRWIVVAADTGKTVPQVALNWLLQRPSVATLIIGARNEEQLRQNLGAVGWNLTPAHVAALDAASATTPAYPYWHQKDIPREESVTGVTPWTVLEIGNVSTTDRTRLLSSSPRSHPHRRVQSSSRI